MNHQWIILKIPHGELTPERRARIGELLTKANALGFLGFNFVANLPPDVRPEPTVATLLGEKVLRAFQEAGPDGAINGGDLVNDLARLIEAYSGSEDKFKVPSPATAGSR